MPTVMKIAAGSLVVVLVSALVTACTIRSTDVADTPPPTPCADAATPPNDATTDAASADAGDDPRCDGNAWRYVCDDALMPHVWGFDATCARGFKYATPTLKIYRSKTANCTEAANPADATVVTCCPDLP